jgi:lipid-binding SYLF domain-containing protein
MTSTTTNRELIMKKFIPIVISALLLAIPLSSQALFDKKTPEEQRQKMQEESKVALEKLYAEKSSTREELETAKGYAVFSSMGINVLLVSTANGGGILHNNQTGKDIYMNMFSAGGGIGMGVKDFIVVFVFHTQDAMEKFQTAGWDFSGQADANAETSTQGAGAGATATVMPGTSIYQITKAGLALQATLQGTKFWVDKDLN